MTYNTQLSFQNVQLSTINKQGQIWLTSSDLAKALDYKSSKSVTNIFNSNSDEFTSSMSQVIESVTSGNYIKKVRIFSLRGCHLIAMFSRTKVAKAFRKWVLDILDKEIGISSTINLEQQQAIRQAVNERAYRTGEYHQAIYCKLHQEFKIQSYINLPSNKFDEAIKFLGKFKFYQFTDDELCTLAWCYKAGEIMRSQIELITEGLYQIRSDFAPSFYSMGREYKRTLEMAREIIEREVQHIIPTNQDTNWDRVLPSIRLINK